MSDPIQMLNTSVEIQSVLGSAKNITGITNATEGVVSSTAHGFLAGDILLIGNVQGMTKINRRAVRVKSSPATDSLTLQELDTTGFGTYTSGGTLQKVTTFLSFDTLTAFNFAEPQPNPQSATTIHDTEEREVFGLDSAPTITLDGQAQPTENVIKEVRKTSLAKDDRIYRVTFQNGNIMIFNAKTAGGRGIEGSAGDIAKNQITLKLRAPEQVFAS